MALYFLTILWTYLSFVALNCFFKAIATARSAFLFLGVVTEPETETVLGIALKLQEL